MYDDPSLLYNAQPVGVQFADFDSAADQWQDEILDEVFAAALEPLLDR